MSERIVNALEFVDVDVKHPELFAVVNFFQFPFKLLAEQHPVRQAGQRIVMRHMSDPLLGAPALRGVFEGGDPSAIRQRTIQHLHRTAAWRIQNDLISLALRQTGEKGRAVFVDVAGKRSGFLAMRQQALDTEARLDHVGGDAEHVDIALVADHEPLV